MSMSRQNETSSLCSSSTPNNPPDADPESHTDINNADPDTPIKQPSFPCFLVVQGTDPQKKLQDQNSDITDRTIRGVTSESVSIRWMGAALLVEVAHRAYAHNLLSITQIGQVPVKVSPHRSLNSRKGVAKFGRAASGMSNEEVKDALNSSPRNRDIPFVAEAFRVVVSRNNERRPTGTFFLTFQGTSLPQKIRLGFEQFDVDPYIPSPRRCFKCQRVGHNSGTCRAREDVCSTCSISGHKKETCPNPDEPKCLNCSGPHPASSKECPRFAVEKAAVQIQAKSHCSLTDARKQVEQASATSNPECDSYASAAHQSPHTVNQLTHQNQALECENRNKIDIIQILKVQNESLQEQINKLNTSVLELQNLIKALNESNLNMRETQSPTHQSAVLEPSIPRDAEQLAVPQPALPRDKQVGSSVGGSHSQVRSSHNPNLQKGPNPLAKSSTGKVNSPQEQPYTRSHQSKGRVDIAPSFIPTQALTPRTKVLLDRSGPGGNRQGGVSPATKQAGDRPQRLSSMKWWRPISFNGTLEGLDQTEEILTS